MAVAVPVPVTRSMARVRARARKRERDIRIGIFSHNTSVNLNISNMEMCRPIKKNTYHWCPHHEIWTVHKPEYFEMEETGKDKMSDPKPQEDDIKGQGETFASELATIIINVREE